MPDNQGPIGWDLFTPTITILSQGRSQYWIRKCCCLSNGEEQGADTPVQTQVFVSEDILPERSQASGAQVLGKLENRGSRIIAISTVPCRIQTTRRILATQPEWKPKAANLQSQRSLKSQSRGKAVKQVHYLLAIRTATRKSPAARERSRQQLLRPLPSRGLKGISILELCTKPLHCVSEVFHLLLLWTLDCIIRANICLFGRSLGLLSTLFPGHLRKVWKREGFF